MTAGLAQLQVGESGLSIGLLLRLLANCLALGHRLFLHVLTQSVITVKDPLSVAAHLTSPTSTPTSPPSQAISRNQLGEKEEAKEEEVEEEEEERYLVRLTRDNFLLARDVV